MVVTASNTPEESEVYSDEFITVIARNEPPERCFTCGAVARWRYHENPYVAIPPEHGDPIVAPPYFCDGCAPDQQLARLRNSPRVGVGC